jgi:signal transduction histidine kinase
MEPIYDSSRKLVDFKLIDANPAFERLTAIKNPAGCLLSGIFPEMEDYWLEALEKVTRSGEPLRYVNESKRSGHWFSLNAFKVQTNGLDAIAVLFYDVTRKMIERNEMAKLLKVQDEVFANVSHELKTPLSVIFSTIQLLELYIQRDALDSNKYSVCKSIRTIKQNCYRFTKLINNIVDLSRIDSGFFKLDLSNENIVDIVENIVQSIAGYISGKGLSVVFDTDIEEKIIACDPGKIERIMLNLISNAIKFSKPQGKIFVIISDHVGKVEIAVKDTGIGIEEKYLDAIFERFSQVDKTLTRNAEGSGIGLSLVKSIVDLHGGSVSVRSKVGKGSTFRVFLPVRTIEQQKEPKQKIPSVNKVEMINIEFSDIYHL